MRKKIIFISTVLILFLLSCSLINKKEPLTSTQIENYLDVYTQLREKAPGILESINSDPKNAEIGTKEFAKIQDIIKNGGFENYAEFVVINAKIGSIFTILQAKTGMDSFEDLNDNSKKMFNDGVAEIDKILNDPNIPEEVKAEKRKLKKQLSENVDKLKIN